MREGETTSYYPQRRWLVGRVAFTVLLLAFFLYQMVAAGEYWPDTLYFVFLAAFGVVDIVRFKNRPLLVLAPDLFVASKVDGATRPNFVEVEVPYGAVQRIEEVGNRLEIDTELEGLIEIELNHLHPEIRRQLLEDFRARVPKAALPGQSI